MTVALPMLMLGMATAWPSPTLPKIKENNAPLSLDHSEISWVVSLMFFGNTLSPLPVGQLMDKIGRKWTLYVLNVMPLTAWIITYYSPSAWYLYVARFLNGLAAGAAYTVCAVYIGEIAEPSIRGSMSNFNNLFKTLGGLLVFIVGPYVSYETLALTCGLVPALYFLVAAFIPESPYYLVMMNRKQEAKEALRWLQRKDDPALDQELAMVEKTVISQTQNKGSVKDLFKDRANRKAVGITMILSVVKNLSGYDVMMAYTSTTLPPEAFNSFGPNECVIILGVISVVTCIGSIFILDKYPRRFLLTLSSLGCSIMTLLPGLWFFLNDNTSVDVSAFAQIPFYCFAIHAVVYSVGLGPIVANVKGELFSANVKAVCSAMTSIVFAILSFLSTKIYLIISDSMGVYVNYLLYAIGCALGTLLIRKYVIETRGKSLHEIQIRLSERNKTTSVSVISHR
ncbi:facilitated trehalose transporter Tret1-like [Macrosteles quadrilineatus]|nr:facilitated trehalose transporter Tret1-like [Macrosteles quadrilineatus]